MDLLWETSGAAVFIIIDFTWPKMFVIIIGPDIITQMM